MVDGKRIVEMAFSIIMTFLEDEGQSNMDECIKQHCDQKITNPVEIMGWVDDIHWHTYRVLYDFLNIAQQYLMELFAVLDVKDWVNARLEIEGWIGSALVVCYDK